MSAPPEGRSARRWGARLMSLFISLRVTTVVLLLGFASTFVGAFVDQGRDPAFYDQEYGRVGAALIRGLGIDDAFHSWWFRALLVVFAAQILLCTIGRFRTAWVQCVHPEAFEPEGGRERIFVPGRLEDVARRAQAQGYRHVGSGRVYAPDEGEGTPGADSDPVGPAITLARGRLQPLGFILLHVSLLIVLAGMTLNLSLGFSQALYLPQGERVLEQNSNRLFELIELEPDYRKVRDEGDETDYELAGIRATIAVYEGGKRLQEGAVELGTSLRFDRGDVVLQPSAPGAQLVFRIATPQGASAVERLSFDAPSVAFPGSDGLQLRVLDFARDAEPAAGGWVRRTPENRDPLAAVAVVRQSADGDDAQVATADMRLGDSLTAEGYTIDFLEAAYMPVAVVSSRDGGMLVVGGFVANLIGVLLSLGFSFRQLRIIPVEGGVEVIGFARRRNQPLAQELALLGGEVGATEDPEVATGDVGRGGA